MDQEPGLDKASLQRMLDANEPERGPTVTDFRSISGGYSRLSALGEVEWADGTSEKFVLRADPPAGTGVFESDRDDEWRLLQSLHGRLPVRTPNVRYYDATGDFFGTKCLVVEHFVGTPLFDIAQRDPKRATEIFVDTIATAHSTPLEVISDHVERPVDWESYVGGLTERLRTLDESVSESNPMLHYAAAQLAANQPTAVPLTLVHGDCQPANILVPEDGPVLFFDWEFGRIGDPREDLGYYSHLPVPPNLYEADPEGFLARYRERTGLTEEQINPTTVSYFYVLGLSRLLDMMLRAAESLFKGDPRGVMATYMLNGISATTAEFVGIARQVAAQGVS